MGILFESDVIPDSGKTTYRAEYSERLFESDVIPDSGKTSIMLWGQFHLFESDVIPDSGKTPWLVTSYRFGLRVM